jgi:hypothetical protein
MKTRIHLITAAFALILGASVAAWPQQNQGNNSQAHGQTLAANHKLPSDVTAPTVTPADYSTKHKNGSKADAGDSIDVVGHLALPGATISNIRTTEDQTRPLLEVTDKNTQIINLVDVADPGSSKIVQKLRKPADLQNSRLEVAVGDAALFAETQDAMTLPRSVSIISFGDHVGPKTVRRFDNVTALWTDRARGFIYLANPEGLWILRPHSVADRMALQKQADEMFRNAQTP